MTLQNATGTGPDAAANNGSNGGGGGRGGLSDQLWGVERRLEAVDSVIRYLDSKDAAGDLSYDEYEVGVWESRQDLPMAVQAVASARRIKMPEDSSGMRAQVAHTAASTRTWCWCPNGQILAPHCVQASVTRPAPAPHPRPAPSPQNRPAPAPVPSLLPPSLYQIILEALLEGSGSHVSPTTVAILQQEKGVLPAVKAAFERHKAGHEGYAAAVAAGAPVPGGLGGEVAPGVRRQTFSSSASLAAVTKAQSRKESSRRHFEVRVGHERH